jgi:hypothetical protein
VTRRKRQEKEKLIFKKSKFENNVSRGLWTQKTSIEQTLHHLNNIQVWWRRRQSLFSLTSPEGRWAALASTMIYVWPIWALVNKMAGTRLVLMFLGSLFLVESAAWFKIAVMAFKRNPIFCSVLHALWSYNVALISYVTGLGFKFKSIPDSNLPQKPCLPKTSLLSCHETYRCEIPVIIEIYENQVNEKENDMFYLFTSF